jgi:hypothetical protein
VAFMRLELQPIGASQIRTPRPSSSPSHIHSVHLWYSHSRPSLSILIITIIAHCALLSSPEPIVCAFCSQWISVLRVQDFLICSNFLSNVFFAFPSDIYGGDNRTFFSHHSQSHFKSTPQALHTRSTFTFQQQYLEAVNMRAVIFRNGRIGTEKCCMFCDSEITPTEACATHFGSEVGFAFHTKCLDEYLKSDTSIRCPDCHCFLDCNENESMENELEPRKVSKPPVTPPATPGQRHNQDRQAQSESDKVWEDSNPFKEAEPEIPYLQCTFQSPNGLMELISSGQASIQSLTGNQVWELHLSPTDKREALKLSSALTGFSRIFYHAPGQPRDESTLILTHPNVNKPFPELESSRDASIPSVLKAELDILTNMINTFRRKNDGTPFGEDIIH